MPRIFVCGRRILRLYKSMLKSGQWGLRSIGRLTPKSKRTSVVPRMSPEEEVCRCGKAAETAEPAPARGLSIAEDADGGRLRVESENVSLHASGDGPKRCVCAEIRQAPGRCGNGACAR